MKRTTKLVTGALLTAALFVSACSSGKQNQEPANQQAAAKTPDPVTLKVMLFGERPKDLDLVLAEFEQKTKETLNTKLNFEYNPNADHKQKLGLRMAAGEEVDVVFDAPWMLLNQNVSQGAYQQLDKYFNNDQYPGLKKAFSPDFINSQKVGGHIYTIPFTQYFRDIEVVLYRGDLRKKYGMQPLKNYEDLQKYLEKVQQEEKGMVPLGLEGRMGYWFMFAKGAKSPQVASLSFTGGLTWSVLLSADGKKVEEVTTWGDPDSAYAKFPAPFNSLQGTYSEHDKFVEFNKYLEKDVLSQKDAKALFTAGKAASTIGTINDVATRGQKLRDSVPGAEIEIMTMRLCAGEQKPGCIPGQYRSNNSVAIPTSSKNIDRTMKFFDWLFSEKANHDLFEYGIEGKHWIAVGNDQYKMGPDSKNYAFQPYEFTWNPTMVRVNADLDETTKKMYAYAQKPDTYYKEPLSTFVFNTEPVKSEWAKIGPKAEPITTQIKNGLFKDWQGAARQLNAELKPLGLDKIREEVKKQAQAYLDAGNK